MEQLFQFLLKHWYLVLIGLTFLYQIQSKGRRAANGKPPKSGMPAFGGPPGQGQKPSAAKRHETQGESPAARPRGAQEVYGRSNTPVAAEAGPKASPFSSPRTALQDNSSVYEGDLTSPRPFPDTPSQEQLLQGVVWSEILGPPRSKKPFRR